MLKNKKISQRSSYIIVISIFGFILYSAVYTALDLTIRFDLLNRGLYVLSLLPIAIFSIGVAYGMINSLTNKKADLILASILLGSIMFVLLGYLFYIFDGFIIYTRY